MELLFSVTCSGSQISLGSSEMLENDNVDVCFRNSGCLTIRCDFSRVAVNHIDTYFFKKKDSRRSVTFFLQRPLAGRWGRVRFFQKIQKFRMIMFFLLDGFSIFLKILKNQHAIFPTPRLRASSYF